MITELGKLLRIIRIKSGDSSAEMAHKLEISPSYLSAIENGKRNIPTDIGRRILNVYPMSDDEKEKLDTAILESGKSVKIDLMKLPESKQHVIIEIARDSFPESKLKKIREIIDSRK